MALVSREVASYPMQGAVERPPAPTLSPVPNPRLSASPPSHLSLFLLLLLFPLLLRAQNKPRAPSVFLRSRMRRITGIPPSKPKVVPPRRASALPPRCLRSGPLRYFTADRTVSLETRNRGEASRVPYRAIGFDDDARLAGRKSGDPRHPKTPLSAHAYLTGPEA